jgi:hypothetical protein
MNRILSVLCLAFAACAASCSNATDSQATLVGDWVRQESLSPRGYLTTQLTFRADGTFTNAGRMFGCYPGQAANDLCAYTIVSGTFTTDDDRRAANVTRVVTWDRFYGASSPETVENVNFTAFNKARFQIAGRTLTLHFLTYPADAPEPTTRIFVRAE